MKYLFQIIGMSIALFINHNGIADTHTLNPSLNLLQEGQLNNNGWKQIRSTDDYIIYEKKLGDSVTPTVLGSIVFNIEISRLYKVITDYDHFSEFIPNTETSKILKKEGQTQWVAQSLTFPSPVRNRAYVIRIEHTVSPNEDYYIIKWGLDHISPVSEASGSIRPKFFSGFWILQKEQNNHTKAIYAIHTDPGGMIPQWLTHWANQLFIPKVFKAIKTRVQLISN